MEFDFLFLSAPLRNWVVGKFLVKRQHAAMVTHPTCPPHRNPWRRDPTHVRPRAPPIPSQPEGMTGVFVTVCA